jgi:DNA-binding transcriptional MerR regulator/methylmalonyl-CoA mutase cobalamin-binding subunit
MEAERGHPIQVVVRRTGLSAHVIRVWEKRYGAVEPMRTPTNRRRYADNDIERLQLLQRVTQTGRSIGQVAHLDTETLRDLIREDELATPLLPSQASTPSAALSIQGHLDACLAAVARLDASDLEAVLLRARVALSQPVFNEQLIVPLMEDIGQLWHDGTLRIAHEHLASAVVRTCMGSLNDGTAPASAAPRLIVTTPVGQWHEIGALIVASTAAADGWQVTYLGPNLPAEEIAAAVQQQGAKAVALSLVYPADDPHVMQDVTMLRRYLPKDVNLLVGGRGSAGYAEVLTTLGVIHLHNMVQLRHHLDAIRARVP